VADLSVRAEGYAFPGLVVDGNDVLAVYEATLAAVERARSGQGPAFIEGKTYRFRGHYEGDPMVYRSKEEMQTWRQRDPVPGFRNRLLESEAAGQDDLVRIEDEVQAALDEAVEFAASSPGPELDSALEGVYGETHSGMVF
jgi:pyruvate dehydrogenase E1 component alpha subunit